MEDPEDPRERTTGSSGLAVGATKRPYKKSEENKASFLVPVKTLGRVVDGRVGPSLYHRGGMWFSAVVSGALSFSVISLDTLKTVFFVTIEDDEEDNHEIDVLASREDYTIAYTSSRKLYSYSRDNLLWSRSIANDDVQSVLKIMFFEEVFIIITKTGLIQVRKTRDGSILTSTQTSSDVPITEAIHPNTLLNKILLGFSDGHMELWNVKTGHLIHSFPFKGRDGQKSSAVTCIAQSPDSEIIAVAFANGQVVVMNIKSGEELGRLGCTSAIISVGFRFDSPPGDAQIMTAERLGTISIWSITGKARPIAVAKDSHFSHISFASFLVGQPIIVSFSGNCVKEWILESEGCELRLLRFREGPQHPIANIDFIDFNPGVELVCWGGDECITGLTLGLDTKVYRTSLMVPPSATLPSKVNSLQRPKVILSSTFTANTLGWDDTVVLFDGLALAKTMNKRKNANGKYILTSSDNEPLVCGRMSPCGHFCVLGSAAGLISIWNMQSGQLRFSFVSRSRDLLDVSFDAVSRLIVYVTVSGCLSIYSVKQRNTIYEEQFDFMIKKALFKTDSESLYMLCDDHCIRQYDFEAKKVVRLLEPSQGLVTDFTVTNDSKYLVTVSPDPRDGRTGNFGLWDMISGMQISSHHVSRLVKCIAMSPDSQYLATISVDCNYAELWWFLPHSISADASSRAGLSGLINSTLLGSEVLLSLSKGSISVFNSFLNYQKLREQNKPKVPLKKSSTAPFFLSELASAKSTSLMPQVIAEDEPGADINRELSSEGSQEDIRQFLLNSPAASIHDEFALAEGSDELLQKIAEALCTIAFDPACFDRALILFSILIQYCSTSKCISALERCSVSLNKHWDSCRNLLHSSSNAVRFIKGRHVGKH